MAIELRMREDSQRAATQSIGGWHVAIERQTRSTTHLPVLGQMRNELEVRIRLESGEGDRQGGNPGQEDQACG